MFSGPETDYCTDIENTLIVLSFVSMYIIYNGNIFLGYRLANLFKFVDQKQELLFPIIVVTDF